MIFAEFQYEAHYDEMHRSIVEFIETQFSNVQSGHQGDSWIWVMNENEKVEIDTFSSMKHQIKAPNRNSLLVHHVIGKLKEAFTLIVYPEPMLEAHEE